MIQTRISDLFTIEYPIIQGGMVWVSGCKLAAAVSNAGGLGLIGSGSMYPEILRQHLAKIRTLTSKPFGVNIPLISPYSEELITIVISEKVPVVFTSAGNPNKFTSKLKDNGIKVVHVVPNVSLAIKVEAAGTDAVVAEGFEAGGHNGRDEITTMALIPQVKDAVKIPVIAAGGIGDGRGMAAALALGAEGVQIGTRFIASKESSAHENFKQIVVNSRDDSSMLTMKKLIPVRLYKNEFYQKMLEKETAGEPVEKLADFLGKGRARQGMFEGDLTNGELEIGQIAGLVKDILPAGEIVKNIVTEFHQSIRKLSFFKGE